MRTKESVKYLLVISQPMSPQYRHELFPKCSGAMMFGLVSNVTDCRIDGRDSDAKLPVLKRWAIAFRPERDFGFVTESGLGYAQQ